MRRVLHSLPVLLTALVLPACGASEPGTASRDEAPAVARVASAGDVSGGRTGSAVARSDSGDLRELARGGAADPSEPAGGPGRRDGVGAGDACTEVDLAPAADNLDRVRASTLCLLNGERADHGLRPLTENDQLARAARGHSADMVANSYFAHEGRDGSEIRDRIGATGYIPSSGRWVIGENLAWGTGALATPKAIMNAWMNSSGHRANILHADYREIGFGIVVGNPSRTNGLGATFATEFGVRNAADAAEPRLQESGAAAKPASSKRASKRSKARRTKARRAKASRAKARRAKAARAKQAKARRASTAKA